MLCSRSFSLLAVFGSAGLLLSGEVSAGEPIRFSAPTLTNSVPKASAGERISKKPGIFDKSTGNTTVDAPLPAPDNVDTISAERLREAIERQKYWIFLKPEDLQKSSKSSKENGKEKVDSNGNPVKSKSILERYFDDADKKKNQESKSSDSADEETVREEKSGLDVVSRSDTELRQGLNWDNLFKDSDPNSTIAHPTDFIGAMFKRQALGGAPGSSSAALSPEGMRAKQAQQERSDSFDRLVGRGGPKGMLPAEGNLINSAVDTTRQPLNPITSGFGELDSAPAKALEGLSGLSGSSLNSSLRNIRIPGGDDLGSKLGGGGIFNPPTANSFLSAPPKPMNFDFPKRKF